MDDKKFEESKLCSALKLIPDIDLNIKVEHSPNTFVENLAITFGIKTRAKIHGQKVIEAIAEKIVTSEQVTDNLRLEARNEDRRHWYLKTRNKNAKGEFDRFGSYFRDSLIKLADGFVGDNVSSRTASYQSFINEWNAACDEEKIPFKVNYDPEGKPKVTFQLKTNEQIAAMSGGDKAPTAEQIKNVIIPGIRSIENGLNDIVNLKERDLKLNTLRNLDDLTPKERIIKGLEIAVVCLLAAAVFTAFTCFWGIMAGGLAMAPGVVQAGTWEVVLGMWAGSGALTLAAASAAVVEVGISIATAFEKPYIGKENKEVFRNYREAVEGITASIDRIEKEFPTKFSSKDEEAKFHKAKGLMENAKDAVISARSEIEVLENQLTSSAVSR